MAPTQQSGQVFVVRDEAGNSVNVPWDRDRITLGRSRANELSYPDNTGLSRHHLSLQRIAGRWFAEDLGSKNGTLLNGKKLAAPLPFNPGDCISAGHLTIEFDGTPAPETNTVEFVEGFDNLASTTTLVASLDAVLGAGPAEELGKEPAIQGSPQIRALIRAGRELAGHRPLAELFDVIMDLSMEAVNARRGVLLTLERDKLVVRAARGEGFEISATVRDRVLRDRASLLVRDALFDQDLREHRSIVEQEVRSMIAVPLQTNDRVIGLIYVDQPDMIQEFTPEDLNLLTVMANVAAIRIEHARLNMVEEAERVMAKELQQAAQIQKRLLPDQAPVTQGLDIAGRTAACRTVGGDYYDFLLFNDGRIGMLVGDVAGKGMPASLLMSSLQARVQVVFEDPDHVALKMTRLNKATCANCPDSRFITLFMSIADPTTGEVVYSNAGHNPPLLVLAGGGYETLRIGGMVLGILGSAEYQEARVTMNPGDTLVLFSDGVTEAADPTDQEYGEQRIADVVSSMRDRPAAEIVDAILTSVTEFTQGAPAADDITVVVARKT